MGKLQLGCCLEYENYIDAFDSAVFCMILMQISELNHVNLPVMLMPDDFKAFTKIRVDNHMFNK